MTRSRWWILLGSLSVGIVVLDVVTGPYILFPITFLIPVCLGAWHLSRNVGIGYAILLVVCRFGIVVALEQEIVPIWAEVVNAGIRLVVLIGLAVLTAKVACQKRMLAERVRVLEGILPICMFCKKIRRPDGEWEQIDAYISKNSTAQFSHGFCEECGREHYGEYFEPVGSRSVETKQPGAMSSTEPHQTR